MMRLWMTTYAEPSRLGGSAAVSATVHGGLIVARIVGTLGAPRRLEQRIAERVQFLPPPDRVLRARGATETVHFMVVATDEHMGPAKPEPHRPAISALPEGDHGTSPVVVPVKEAVWNEDSVASVLDVDSAVERFPESSAPAYPKALLAKSVEGAVNTTYVVDTTGVADTASLVVLSATDTAFARAVREALPYMKFHPAIRANRKVRQLVSQTFVFKIVRPPPADTTTIKKSGIE